MRASRRPSLWRGLATAAILVAQPALAQSPPIIVDADDGPEPSPSAARAAPSTGSPVLLSPQAEARCDEEPVTPVSAADLPPGLYASTFQRPQVGQRITTAAILFEIDETGRPLGIRAAPADSNGATDGLAPTMLETTHAAFAGWRFPPGQRSGCRLTIRYTPTPIGRAEPPLLARFYGVTRTSGPAREAVEARLRGPDRDCDRGRRAITAGYPDYNAGRPRPRVQDWTVIQWSVDAEGRPFDVVTLDSSGDPGFDAEGRRVTETLRLEPGPVATGCLYNWFRRGDPLPAPSRPAPPPDALAACPRAVLDQYRPGETGSPVAQFRARGIEGWALVRFDIAPWGEVGSVEVIDAQPAAAFGEAARRIVAGGRGSPGPGAVRCIQPVEFRVPAQR